MCKTLIFPDLHLRFRQVDQILSWESFHRVIFLADYFDMFSDTPEQNQEMAEWLRPKLDDPMFVCLQGNHDSSYRWPGNEFAYASGFSWAKNNAIKEILGDEDFSKMRPCHVEQDILFSHAGVDRAWLGLLGLDEDKDIMAAKVAAAVEKIWPGICKSFAEGGSHPFLGVGFDRGGWQSDGGITWQDFSKHRPIKGVRQVVGHSKIDPAKGPLFRLHGNPCWKLAAEASQKHLAGKNWTLDLDTALHHYAILEDGKMTIKSVVWKRPKGQIDFHVEPGETICEATL